METVTIWQVIVGLLVPINITALGWILKRIGDNERRNQVIHSKIFERLERVEEKFEDHRVYSEQSFAKVQGMKDVEDRIMRHLDGIEKTLGRLSDVIINHLAKEVRTNG